MSFLKLEESLTWFLALKLFSLGLKDFFPGLLRFIAPLGELPVKKLRGDLKKELLKTFLSPEVLLEAFLFS